jgi:hypothetical protein
MRKTTAITDRHGRRENPEIAALLPNRDHRKRGDETLQAGGHRFDPGWLHSSNCLQNGHVSALRQQPRPARD